MSHAAQFAPREEFITLIGATMAEINAQYQAQGLASRDYAIVHKTGRHRFMRVDGAASEDMFEGQEMIAATFRALR